MQPADIHAVYDLNAPSSISGADLASSRLAVALALSFGLRFRFAFGFGFRFGFRFGSFVVAPTAPATDGEEPVANRPE